MGTKQPTNDWILFPRAVTGTETFRLSHSISSKKPFKLYCLIAQFFFERNSPVGLRRVYPVFGDKPVINLDIPENLRQSGFVTRFIGVKLPPHILDPRGYIKWFVSLEELLEAPLDRIDQIQADLGEIEQRLTSGFDAVNNGLNDLIG